MDINEESDYLPYVLGRMFSIYEQIQLAAIPGINTTIKDKYFTSASATPARIFPILGDLAAKHMRKTWKSEGLKVWMLIRHLCGSDFVIARACLCCWNMRMGYWNDGCCGL